MVISGNTFPYQNMQGKMNNNELLQSLDKIYVVFKTYQISAKLSKRDIIEYSNDSSFITESFQDILTRLVNEIADDYKKIAETYYHLELNRENFHEMVLRDFECQDIPQNDEHLCYIIRTTRCLVKNP